MTKHALVLGGGGALGVAWETGVLTGLAESGVDVTLANLIVGTSAGSVVGAQIAQGKALPELMDQHFAEHSPGIESNMEFNPANLIAIFQKWATLENVNQAACAEIGRMALASKTVSEERWVASFEELVAPEWPERRLLLTAVDAESGELRAWSNEDGIDVRRAVASSCAVPGMFPCVEFNGRRYQDGGVRSGTNADLAAGYDNVLIIAPIGSRTDSIDPLLGRIARREAEALRATGSRVELLFTDDRSNEVMGINRMDSSKRGVMAEEGLGQGRDLAARLYAWSRVTA